MSRTCPSLCYCAIELTDIQVANNKVISAIGIWDMTIQVPKGKAKSIVQLTNVLYALKLGFNLVSITRIDDAGYVTTFVNGCCKVCNHADYLIACFPKS